MEIPIAMVLLSVVLPFAPHRWESVGARATMTAVPVASLFVGGPTIYLACFRVIEIAASAFIVWGAWTWHRAGSRPRRSHGSNA